MTLWRKGLFLSIILHILLIQQSTSDILNLIYLGETIVSNNYTLTPGVDYVFNFTYNYATPINAGSYVTLQFRYRYNITNTTLTNCKTSIDNNPYVPSNNCSVQSSGSSTSVVYVVTFPNVYPTALSSTSTISLALKITNPWGGGTSGSQTIIVNAFDQAGGSLATGQATIQFYPTSMSNCTYTSDSYTTGVNSTKYFGFLPFGPVLNGSSLQVTMPLWFNGATNSPASYTCQGVSNSDPGPVTCPPKTTTSPNQFYTLSGFITTGVKQYLSAVVLSIGPLRNPWSFNPFGGLTYQLINSGIVSQICTGVTLTMNSSNIFPDYTLDLPLTPSISTSYPGYGASLSILNPFPGTSGYVLFKFPDTASIIYVSTTGSASNVTNTSMVISGLSSTSLTSQSTSINMWYAFNITTPPSSQPFTLSFTSLFKNGSNFYPIDTISITITPLTGSITSASVVPTSSFVNDVTLYTINFTTQNGLTSGSYIQVVFPPTLSVSGSCGSTNAFISCTVTNLTSANLSITGSIPAFTSISLTFNQVTNPNQAFTTNSIKIYTYYNSSLATLVDTLTSGLTMTAKARPITAVTIDPTSLITYALTNYYFTIKTLDPIPSGGNITITFPSSISLGSVNITSSSFSNVTCSVIVSGNSVTLTSCFSSPLAAGTLTLNLSNIYNPPSLQPTSSFSIITAGPLGQVNYINSSLSVTMITPAATNTFTLSPASSVVHALTTYTLTFSMTVPHSIGDYFTFKIDNSMALSSLTCPANVSCSQYNSSLINVTFTSIPLSNIQVAISSIRNYDISNTNISFQVFFYNSANYQMEKTSIYNLNYTTDTIPAVSINHNEQIAAFQNSNITLTMSSPFAIASSFAVSSTSLVIIAPAEFSTLNNTNCTTSSGSCTFSGLTFTISSVGTSFTNLVVVLANIKLPYITGASSSFSFSYKYNGNNIATNTSGVTLSLYCTDPCERCSSNSSFCYSCLPVAKTSYIYLFSSNNSCLQNCPKGYYNDSGNNCQPCTGTCLWCTDSVNCTKCVVNTWLYQSSCSSTCPSTYYNDSSGVCLSCVSPCATCTTNTSCITCKSTFFFYSSSCLNASDCPSTTFANTTSNKCDPCGGLCVTCLYNSSTSCLSCTTGYLYFSSNNSCLLLCPDTYFNNSGICTGCTGLCGNCTSATFCTSCISNYLDRTTGQCVSACPSGTIADLGTKTCATCPNGCTGCTSLTNCTGCSGIYLFYNYQCIFSCPNTTYQTNRACQNCSSLCPTCSGSATSCTSCNAPLVLYSSSCQSGCPSGTFNSSGVCQTCLSSCQTCTSGSLCTSCPSNTFLINGLCQSGCPSGTFQDVTTGTCASCSPNCSTCSGSSTSCTSCPSGSLFYNNSCISSCPFNYFPINGNCVTCGNCITCSSAITCVQCYTGYYLFGGACYSQCPDTGIADATTMTCTQCDSSCLTCSGITTNCTTCKGGTYLYKSVCFSTCPSGLIANGISNTCDVSTIGNLVYFPCSITFVIWFIVIVYSRCHYPKTEGVTSIASGLALILWFAWMILIFTASNSDKALSTSSKTTVLGVGMTGVLCSLCLGLAFNISVKKNFVLDSGFIHWVQHNNYNLNSYRIIFSLSCLTMPFFRMIYSRIFNRKNFSCFFIEGAEFLRMSNWFTFFAILFCIMPQIFVCGFIIYIKQTYDQTLIYAIDVLILSLFLLVFLIIDIASKGDDFFDEMIDEQPYLKRLKYNDLNQSASCLRFLDEDNKPIYKSQLDPREKEEFFRMKVNFIEDVNKFGHLNTPMPQPIAPARRVKTLPQDLQNLPQLDPNEDDIVMNQDLFFQQEERRRKREEEQQEERRRREQQQRLRKLRQQQQEERQRRRKQMLEDQDQQHQIEFPDLAAIEKLEQKLKKSPTQLLNKFKTVDDKNINQKALKKLEEVAKKNGLDAQFMAQTFGVQKNHNPQLLNAIIDKHNHVNRQAVKQLFSSDNNPEILQNLFGKNSALDTQKLKELLNDPNSAEIIKNLANAQLGIISPQIAKLLLDKNSKFSEQFVKQLLGGKNGMDSQRLKQMLKDNPDKAVREAALKALKKIGGNNLENKQLLKNMLGQESKLSNEAFIKAANQLPKSVLQNLFKQKSQTNDLIIQKLLNNPKIDFKKLTPILEKPQLAKQLSLALGKAEDAQTLQRVISDLPPEIIQQLFGNKSQANEIIINKVLKNKKIDLTKLTGILSDPALVQQLAHALNHEDPMVQQNLLNLLKNGEKISPQLLKQFLSKPDLMKKLLTNPIDPAFLVNLLSEESKTDLKLFQKALGKMQPQQIAQIFSYNPEKNVDFAKMAKIFEANPKSDPKLIAELLTPELIENIYSKSSTTKAQILNKLVEKGKKINTEQIIKIYGQDEKQGFGSRDPDRKYNITDNNFKYNNTENNFNLLREDQDSETGFKKQANINSMSRTDGVAGFLSPIQIGLPRGKKKGNNLFNVGSIDDISDEQKTEYNQNENGDKDEEEEYEVIDGVRRKKKRRQKKKPLDDIRLPSEQIYLQRLQAPHEMQKKKNLRKKKKKGTTSMAQLEAMDQENEIYDLDF